RHAAASHALQVFQEAFVNGARAAAIGVPRVPLVELYEPLGALLARAGGELNLNTPVARLEFDGRRIGGVVLRDGRRVTADHYVVGVPFEQLSALAPPDLVLADARLAGLRGLTHSPILGIHVWLRAPLVDVPHLVFTDSPLQWLFNRGERSL